jgi:hypothetical protein
MITSVFRRYHSSLTIRATARDRRHADFRHALVAPFRSALWTGRGWRLRHGTATPTGALDAAGWPWIIGAAEGQNAHNANDRSRHTFDLVAGWPRPRTAPQRRSAGNVSAGRGRRQRRLDHRRGAFDNCAGDGNAWYQLIFHSHVAGRSRHWLRLAAPHRRARCVRRPSDHCTCIRSRTAWFRGILAGRPSKVDQ